MTTHTQKIASNGIFLITQPGDGDIDYYSMILKVPPTREAAFLRACVKTSFAATQFGTLLFYTAGELTLEAARLKAAELVA